MKDLKVGDKVVLLDEVTDTLSFPIGTITSVKKLLSGDVVYYGIKDITGETFSKLEQFVNKKNNI